ncbi:hypothetical protein A6302_00680 [Methylobrevis pamukkalensis]|uniref:Amine oxidase domain-containing protein n=1 Tax=Methylobrevis pamukkalensis TaxID=1439726 RepID=A0A1E3H6I3_9HYPH|nr:hypothetical protein A6302_00680 [Methylobrevis pamukkalensis]
MRFCCNHGLMQVTGRPIWRTVKGGSRRYVERLVAPFTDRVRLSTPIRRIVRAPDGVTLHDAHGAAHRHDQVVIAAHADDALAMLAEPTADERRVLGAFRYSVNEAVLHRDPALMPQRRTAWSAWNYLADRRSETDGLSVTYWMNKLQHPDVREDVFVTLNPHRTPRADLVLRRENYRHPMFDLDALAAQKALWSLQGRRGTWFCGAHFGAGFHEDGLQAGLAVAEDLGGVRRPWTVADDSARIFRGPVPGAGGDVVAEAAAT